MGYQTGATRNRLSLEKFDQSPSAWGFRSRIYPFTCSQKTLKNPRLWKLYVDISSTVNQAGVGMVLMTSNGYILKNALNLRFRASSNETKYDTLLSDLRVATKFQVNELSIHCDEFCAWIKFFYFRHKDFQVLTRDFIEGVEWNFLCKHQTK